MSGGLQNAGEVRAKDPRTGGEKGTKLARYDLIPPYPLHELAEHYGKGAEKYKEPRNWERGYDWGLSFAALMRHAWAFWGGEDRDPETSSYHLTAVAWHAFALLEYGRTHPQGDDRPSTRNAKREAEIDVERLWRAYQGAALQDFWK